MQKRIIYCSKTESHHLTFYCYFFSYLFPVTKLYIVLLYSARDETTKCVHIFISLLLLTVLQTKLAVLYTCSIIVILYS